MTKKPGPRQCVCGLDKELTALRRMAAAVETERQYRENASHWGAMVNTAISEWRKER